MNRYVRSSSRRSHIPLSSVVKRILQWLTEISDVLKSCHICVNGLQDPQCFSWINNRVFIHDVNLNVFVLSSWNDYTSCLTSIVTLLPSLGAVGSQNTWKKRELDSRFKSPLWNVTEPRTHEVPPNSKNRKIKFKTLILFYFLYNSHDTFSLYPVLTLLFTLNYMSK